MEDWTFNDRIKYGSKPFIKILDFYLYRCPTADQSVRSILFKEYGWAGVPAFAELKRLMLDAASPELKDRYKPCNKDALETMMIQLGLDEKKPKIIEGAVFLSTDGKTVMESLYRAIRHAFAHGSFYSCTRSKEKFYLLENFDGYCKARLVLKETTLLRWIDIVKNGYHK